jgi:hypothetical protein
MKCVTAILLSLCVVNASFAAYEMFEDDVAVVETDSSGGTDSGGMVPATTPSGPGMSGQSSGGSGGGSSMAAQAAIGTTGGAGGLGVGAGGGGGGGASNNDLDPPVTNDDPGVDVLDIDPVSVPEPATALIWTILAASALGLTRFARTQR